MHARVSRVAAKPNGIERSLTASVGVCVMWAQRDSSRRYSCVGNSVGLHMSTDDPSQLPPPFNREYKGLNVLHAITAM
jgi:hypothetical protein